MDDNWKENLEEVWKLTFVIFRRKSVLKFWLLWGSMLRKTKNIRKNKIKKKIKIQKKTSERMRMGQGKQHLKSERNPRIRYIDNCDADWRRTKFHTTTVKQSWNEFWTVQWLVHTFRVLWRTPCRSYINEVLRDLDAIWCDIVSDMVWYDDQIAIKQNNG